MPLPFSLREICVSDYDAVLGLYEELASPVQERMPLESRQHFEKVLSHEGLIIIGAQVEGAVGAMATLHILPNMTYGGRPYGLIENVVTAKRYRGLGLGSAVLGHVKAIARQRGLYKLMLLCGRGPETLEFYAKNGFVTGEKSGLICRGF